MTQQRPNDSNFADAVDRILDKGVVIDLWVRVGVVGLELITIEARVVVASVDTFLQYCEELAAIHAGEPSPDASYRTVEATP